METPSKVKPALIGGIAMGVISVIPYVSAANCCCAWVLIGGAMAAHHFIKESPLRVDKKTGASVGALAGFVGGIVYSMLISAAAVIMTKGDAGLVERMIKSNMPKNPDAQAQEAANMAAHLIAEHFVIFLFLMSIMYIVVYIIAGAVGGLIGTAIFEKRPATPPPAPPVPPMADNRPPSSYNPYPGSGEIPPTTPSYPPIKPPDDDQSGGNNGGNNGPMTPPQG